MQFDLEHICPTEKKEVTRLQRSITSSSPAKKHCSYYPVKISGFFSPEITSANSCRSKSHACILRKSVTEVLKTLRGMLQ